MASYYGINGILITGRGFSLTEANNTVMIDNQACIIASSSPTQIYCNLAQDSRTVIASVHPGIS